MSARPVCASALTDAHVQNVFVSSNTQASPALSDVFARLECEVNQFQSASQTPEARAAALATADQDIDAAKRLILSMLTRRNMLAPISILPAEILARIFHFAAFSERPYSMGWVNVTHVCRRWRQTALDDSTLWAHFLDFPRNKEWIAERLSRARNAPLTIDLDESMDKDTFSLFTPHISHTRELYLRNLSSFHPKIVQKISIQKAPVLECLELSMSGTAPMGKHHSFFKGPLPKLRTFCISQILFPWSSVPRGQLTQLKVTLNEEVSTVTSKGSRHDDLKQLIGLLVDCPSLEVLTLENCLPSMLSESSGQTIRLPRLLHLCLGGSSSRVMNLLKMLKLSSFTTLRLNCTSENAATDNDYHILPFLSSHFNGPTPVKFRSFKINLDDVDRGIAVVASTSLPTLPTPYTDSDPELSLSFNHFAELSNRMNILRQACDVLSLSNLEFLSIYFPCLNQVINWREIFQQCTEVTTVRVQGRGAIGLLQALIPPKHARGIRGKRKRGDKGRGAQVQAPVHVPVFPKLTSLLLETLDFTAAVPGAGVVYDLVLSAVQLRKANRMPLETLCIDDCVIREKQAKALEKVVHDFRWDQDEGYYCDKEGDREDYHDYYDFGFDDYDDYYLYPETDHPGVGWGGPHNVVGISLAQVLAEIQSEW